MLRVKTTRSNERLNVRYERKGGNKDVSRVWVWTTARCDVLRQRTGKKGRVPLERRIRSLVQET